MGLLNEVNSIAIILRLVYIDLPDYLVRYDPS